MLSSALNKHSSRRFRTLLRRSITQIVPNFVFDNRLLMTGLFWILFRKHKDLFLDFRPNLNTLSQDELNQIYQRLSETDIEMQASINEKCVELIEKNLLGKKIIDVGCGNGLLLQLLSQNNELELHGCDVVLDEELQKHTNITLTQASITKLPFPDKSFDTVVCTHTIEHIIDARGAVNELRRIGRKKLIIIVPCERPYLYTPDLHIHFFPYEFVLRSLLGFGKNSKCILAQGDWYYEEIIDSPNHSQ